MGVIKGDTRSFDYSSRQVSAVSGIGLGPM